MLDFCGEVPAFGVCDREFVLGFCASSAFLVGDVLALGFRDGVPVFAFSDGVLVPGFCASPAFAVNGVLVLSF